MLIQSIYAQMKSLLGELECLALAAKSCAEGWLHCVDC